MNDLMNKIKSYDHKYINASGGPICVGKFSPDNLYLAVYTRG